jgi:hypothetical protein
VSRALDQLPSIQLEAIDWTSGEPVAGGSQTAPGKPGLIPSGNSETLVLRGAIQLNPTASARQTLTTFEHFVELLQVDRSNEVSVLQQPFDIESGRALRGGDAESESNQQRQFALQIVRKAAP